VKERRQEEAKNARREGDKATGTEMRRARRKGRKKGKEERKKERKKERKEKKKCGREKVSHALKVKKGLDPTNRQTTETDNICDVAHHVAWSGAV